MRMEAAQLRTLTVSTFTLLTLLAPTSVHTCTQTGMFDVNDIAQATLFLYAMNV